jgi:hypothetical protein
LGLVGLRVLLFRLKFASKPEAASFQFYFRTRFDMAALDFEEFLYQVYTIGGSDSKNGAGYLKLTSSRVLGV